LSLSATLGEMKLAAELLRPGGTEEAVVLESCDGGQAIKLQIRGYVAPRRANRIPASVGSEESPETEDVIRRAIADRLFQTLRGTHNLVFAGARQSVEIYADLLRQKCDDLGVPNESFAGRAPSATWILIFIRRCSDGWAPPSLASSSRRLMGSFCSGGRARCWSTTTASMRCSRRLRNFGSWSAAAR
jgi:hypothetical protein